MSKNEKQIILLTLVGVVLALVSAGVAAAAIPLVIGLLALVGEWLYQNEVEKAKTSEQSPEVFTKQRRKFVSRQVMTPAYKKILTQRKEFVNHETY